MFNRPTLILLVAVGVLTGTLGLQAPSAQADAACDRYASPTGSDANAGTQAHPVRSIAKLISILGPDQDGCVPAGSTFVEPIGSFIVSSGGGTPGHPATVRTDDPAGTPAQIKGAAWLKGPAHDLTFEHVGFTDSPGNGDKATMLVIHGDRITFRDTEITYPRGICLNAGHREGYVAGDPAGTVAAEGLVIERSRIHDCGTHPDIIQSLRARGQSGAHGLYLINAPNARIRDNFIYDNVSRGLQFWPDVDGAVVERNVFDGNGTNINIGSSAPYGHYSENNLFRDNVVSNATLRSVYDQPWGPGDFESIAGNFPADGSTHGNRIESNCIYQADPSKIFGGYGYSQSDNTLAAPSSCALDGPRGGAFPLPPPASSAPSSTTGTSPPTFSARAWVPARQRLRAVVKRGLLVHHRCSVDCAISVQIWRVLKGKRVRLARATFNIRPKLLDRRGIFFGRSSKRLLRRARRVTLIVTSTARSTGDTRRRVGRRLTIRR